MSLISIFNEGDLVFGTYIEPIKFCKKHFGSKKCQLFYQSLKDKTRDGFYCCPNGMSCYLAKDGTIFTCMREKSTYNKEKAKRIKTQDENVYNPILQAPQLKTLINSSIDYNVEKNILKEKQASVDSISHEVKQLNAQIKERCDAVLQSYHLEDGPNLSAEDINAIYNEIRTIYVSSSMIASRFSLYDYEKNPGSLIKGAQFPCNIYKKFDKIKKILKNYQKKSVNINLIGSTFALFDAFPSFELIPLLIVENAVKYSYGKGGKVDIFFVEQSNQLSVTINSFSPYCSPNDLENIFKKGYRSKNAVRVSDGSGVGLFLVKQLCDLHCIELHITSDRESISQLNDIAYAPFSVKLIFNNIYYSQ